MMVSTFFDESGVSIVTVKKYLQTQFPTFRFKFESFDGNQYLVMHKSLLSKVHMTIKNNSIYFHNIDTVKIKRYQLFYYLLGYIPGLIFNSKKEAAYEDFRNKVVKNIIENIPNAVYESNSNSLHIDCTNTKQSINVNEKSKVLD
ncbi:MAG TPA: hypothetical protein VKA34_19485 [Balneolales bacterium]|nr:hypothetical protein [Balneolales bacterium]